MFITIDKIKIHMLKKYSLFVISFSFIFTTTIGAQTYVVNKKDTLSNISGEIFPEHRIYGRNGMLKKIIALNPTINPHKIKINQIILLPYKVATVDKTEIVELAQEQTSPIELQPISREIASEQPQEDAWILKILYGMKFLSLEQSETLPGFALSSFTSDVLKVESEFQYNKFKFIGSLETYSFSFASTSVSNKEKLSIIELSAVLNNFLLGLSVTEIPLLRVTTTALGFSKETQIGLMFGYDKTWDLKTVKPTTINLNSTITIPFSSSTNKTDTTSRSLKGFEFKAEAEISRVIFKKENYSLSVIWQNELVYGQTARQIKWDTSNGQVKVKKTEAKSLIGLGFNF